MVEKVCLVELTVVNTGSGRPELLLLEVRQGVGSLLAAVRSGPVALGVANEQVVLGVRSVLEDVAFTRLLALLNFADLLTDADQSIGETVKLLLALTLRGLDHEGVGNGPAHGGGVETVVLETLGNVDSLDARGLLEGTSVQDELVSASAVVVSVQDGVVVLDASQDVVRVEKSKAGGLSQTLVAHGRDVSPADGNDAGASVVGTGDGSLVRLVGEVRSKVILDADGANSRATTTVRDTESLVKVQVANISAEGTRRGQTNLSIHVGTVHVDLATILVNNVANLANLGLEDTERARVGNHNSTKLISVLLALLL